MGSLGIDIKLKRDFVSQYNKLQDEYGSYMARLNGFAGGQLSYTDFIDNFIDQDTVADASIDSNSNVSSKDIVTLEREMSKPHKKLLAFNKIHYEIQKKYGFYNANKWLEYEWQGKLYMHDADSSTFRSYCFSYSVKDLAERGLFFLPDRNSAPAKHLITFVDFIKEFVNYNSNRTSGAVGLADLIPYMFYFWKKDVDNDYLGIKTSGNERYYANQAFQRFIYAVNQNFMRDSSQSAFSNTSVFDRPFFEALFGGVKFPDGSYMIDYEEEIIEFQKWYMEEMANIRSQNMFTFPVSSISLLKNPDPNCSDEDFFMDKEFADWAIEHNRKWSDSNLFIDDSVSSLSNCCFDGSQEVVIKVSTRIGEGDSGWISECPVRLSFKSLYDNQDEYKNYKISFDGNWVDGKIVRTNKKQLYKVTLEDGRFIIATEDHLNVTDSHDVRTDNLSIGDKLKCNGNAFIAITSIEKYESDDDYVYCFEIEDQTNPYFSLANGIITHNCRLKSDIKNLYFNSIGATALKVGSVKVGTINLARIALMSETEEEYLENLKEITWIDLIALDRVRHIIKRNVEKGILPNFTHKLIEFRYLYNTIGFIGVYETMKKFGYTKVDQFDNTYYTDEAYAFGEKIFKTMRETADEFIEKYECDYQINTEQIPGESAADKLMHKDKFFYGDANIYDLPLYGNQFVPLGIQTTLQERIKAQAAFDSYCSAGSILHANIDAPFDSFEKAKKMTIHIARAGVTYFAFNTRIQVCKDNHAFYGKTCPVCGEPVAAEFSRIVGFYTKIQSWSKHRKEEYKLRKWANINEN